MKYLSAILSVLLLACVLTACTSGGNAEIIQNTPEETPSQEESADAANENTPNDGGKILVAYFSATGNTKAVAEKAADAAGADIFEIVPAVPYTDDDLDYGNDNSRTTQEQNDDSARPEISGTVENMEQYDTILLGYPIWWGQAPKIMYTFMESYDFSGKTIIPFCTSGSSPIGSSDENMQGLAEGADWLEGIRFPGGASDDEVKEWVDSLGLSSQE